MHGANHRRETAVDRGSSVERRQGASAMQFDDPKFWRAGAIATTVVMAVVLVFLTIDSLAAIAPGGSHVPPYTVINQAIGYVYDGKRNRDMPVIGKDEPLFGKRVDAAEA